MNTYLPICIKANLINFITKDNIIFNANLIIEETYTNGLNGAKVTINSIVNGMWFSNNQSGQAWRINNVSINNGILNCNFEDPYFYNRYINDGNLFNNNNLLQNGFGYIFSLNDNGLPNLFPITPFSPRNGTLFGQKNRSQTYIFFILNEKGVIAPFQA